MKTILSASLLFLFCAIYAQKKFPAAWEGSWAGNLEVFTAAGKMQEIPMELHILPIENSENHTWTIIYGENKETGLREYELIPLDTVRGLYLIDEKNSIAIEGYFLGGKFFQRFEVQSSQLLTTTELAGDELVWEIIAGSTKAVSTTGGEIVGGEEIPPVKTFPIVTMQRARLKKK